MKTNRLEVDMDRESSIAQLKKAAALEARSSWVSPARLGITFVVALTTTFIFNGL